MVNQKVNTQPDPMQIQTLQKSWVDQIKLMCGYPRFVFLTPSLCTLGEVVIKPWEREGFPRRKHRRG